MIKEDTKTLLKFNAEGIHPGEMFFNASLEAAKAVDDYVEKYGEPMYCVLPMFQYILLEADLLDT